MDEQRTHPDDRTHEPTTTRLTEARKRGQIPRSADLTAAVASLAALVVLFLGGRGLLTSMASMTASMLDGTRSATKAGAWVDASRDDVGGAAWEAASPVIARAGGMLAAIAGLAALAAFVQVGPVVATDRAKADWSRVSLSDGWRRLWDKRTKMRALFAVLKVAVVCGVAWWAARPMLQRINATPRLDSWSLAIEAGRMTLSVMFYAGLSLGLLGAADYVHQWRQHRRDLRMTRSEWMEDMIRAEGRPEIRSKRKRAASQRAKDSRRKNQ